MALIEDFRAELLSITAVSDAVGTRVYPIVDIGQSLPSIIYNTRGGGREAYVKGSFGLRETFIQLDVYSNSYSQLDSLRTAIIDHFNGFEGSFNSGADSGGTLISSCKFVTSRELIEGQNNEVYRCVIELNILN